MYFKTILASLNMHTTLLLVEKYSFSIFILLFSLSPPFIQFVFIEEFLQSCSHQTTKLFNILRLSELKDKMIRSLFRLRVEANGEDQDHQHHRGAGDGARG
jgi:hypothetical protein